MRLLNLINIDGARRGGDNPHIQNNNITYKIIIYFLIIGFLSILLSLTSPNNPFSSLLPYTDDSVYMYIGQGMLNGEVPYVDMFDHKGLVLYVIYTIGLGFAGGNPIGIWFMLLGALLISSIFCYLSARCVTKSDDVAFFSTLITMSCTILFSQGWGVTGTYAMPFIFISLYIFTKYLFSNSYNSILSIVSGICLCCVMFIKPSGFELWIVFLLFIFVMLIYQKKVREIFRQGIFFAIGFGLIIFPCILYLIICGAISEFIDIYLGFNLSYAENATFGLPTFLRYCQYFLIALPAIILISKLLSKSINNRDRFICLAFVIYFGLTLLEISFIGNHYLHYGLVFIPCLCIPFAYFFEWIMSINIYKSRKLYSYILPLIIVAILIYSGGCFSTLHSGLTINSRFISSDEATIIDTINENCFGDDKIIIMSYEDKYYVAADKRAASRFSYSIGLNQRYLSEYTNDIIYNNPKLIITKSDEEYVPNIIKNHINENYICLKQTNIHNIYIRCE